MQLNEAVSKRLTELLSERNMTQYQKQILQEYAERNGFQNPRFFVDDTAILGLKSELQ